MNNRRSESMPGISVAAALQAETPFSAVLALFAGRGMLPAGTLALQRDCAGGFCGWGRYGLCGGCALHWGSLFKWFCGSFRSSVCFQDGRLLDVASYVSTVACPRRPNIPAAIAARAPGAGRRSLLPEASPSWRRPRGVRWTAVRPSGRRWGSAEPRNPSC